MELYSRGCEYALRVLTNVIHTKPAEVFSIENICSQEKIPLSFTRKIFQRLTRKGFLQAKTGPKGGYRFRIPPEKISVLDIAKAVDGEDAFDHCIMGFPECCDGYPCPLHSKWKMIRSLILSESKKISLNRLNLTPSRQRKRRMP